MRAVIYCFSGTGNTLLASETLAAKLNGQGIETDLFMLRKDQYLPSPTGYDRMIIAYPVHAFNAPEPILKFLKRLPWEQRQMPVYLLTISGEPLKMNRAAGIVPKRILQKKGYSLRGEMHYVMPYNIIFRHSEGMASRMKLDMERGICKDAKEIFLGKGHLNRVPIFFRVWAFLLRIEHPAMRAIGRTFHVSKDCIGCGICEKSCPQGNIAIKDGKPKFGGKCVGCMSCAFRCPKDAVRISILNGWRVNGEYTFAEAPAKDGEICRFCRKSYLSYFHGVEEDKKMS